MQIDFRRGMSDKDPRGSLHVIFLHIALRIKWLLNSWFFLKPLLWPGLSDNPSFLRPKDMPKPDYISLVAMRIVWLCGMVARSHWMLALILTKSGFIPLLDWVYGYLVQRQVDKIKRSGFDASRCREIPIPEFDWENGKAQDFFDMYVRTPHPVVLRGFAKGRKIMDLTFDNLMSMFGDDEVILSSPKEATGKVHKLKDANDPALYLQNSETLFNRHPHLWDYLETERLEPLLDKKSAYAQLFVGRSGTGAPLHCAGLWNFFHMVDGVKKWYFIDPYDYYLAYPILLWGRPTSTFVGLYPDDFDRKRMPAFEFCPYYTVELNPGDVMLNPPWWGHGIKNLTPKSVGIATRWFTGGSLGDSLFRSAKDDDDDVFPLGSLCFMTGPKSFPFLQTHLREVRTPVDEHSTFTDFQAATFLMYQKMIADGKLDIFGWKPLF